MDYTKIYNNDISTNNTIKSITVTNEQDINMIHDLIKNNNFSFDLLIDKSTGVKNQQKNNEELNSDEILILYNEMVKDISDFNNLVIDRTEKIISKITKVKKNKKKSNIAKNYGFTEQKIIPESIKIFFNIEPNLKLSRIEIGKLFQDYIEKNNLKGNIGSKNKIDKRIYKLDDKLAKLFGLSDIKKNNINSCTSANIKYPDGFNFYNYQTWIKNIYVLEYNISNANKQINNI